MRNRLTFYQWLQTQIGRDGNGIGAFASAILVAPNKPRGATGWKRWREFAYALGLEQKFDQAWAEYLLAYHADAADPEAAETSLAPAERVADDLIHLRLFMTLASLHAVDAMLESGEPKSAARRLIALTLSAMA